MRGISADERTLRQTQPDDDAAHLMSKTSAVAVVEESRGEPDEADGDQIPIDPRSLRMPPGVKWLRG
jgi:hypothetical protein